MAKAGDRGELTDCAAFNHALEPSAPNPEYARVGARHLFLTCTRCGTEKVMDIDTNGEIYGVIYYYSDRYREFLDSDDAGWSKAHYRAVIYKRTRRHLKAVAS